MTLFDENTPESSKIYQKLEAKSGSFFLLNALKYFGAGLFLFSLYANFTYFLKYIPLKKNP